MKIILFLNKDLEANIAYNLLKPELLKHQVKIYYSGGVGRNEAKPEALKKLEFYEKDFFYNKVKSICRQLEIPTTFEFLSEDLTTFKVEKCPKVNAPEFIEKVRQFKPDLFISIRFGKIFKEEIITIPKKGILNLHSAILPDYRGILGTLHNLKADQTAYGCTLHYITDSGIDTGGIIEVGKLPVLKNRSLLWHVVQLYPLGCKLILANLNKLQKVEKLPVKKQDKSKGQYFSVPKESDFEQLKNAGFEVFKMDDYLEVLEEFVGKGLDRFVKLDQ